MDIFTKPKPKEKDLQTKILKDLKTKFPHGYFRKISDKSLSHIPDIIGCINGRFIGIELKMEGKKPRPGQEMELLRITASSGIGVWFDTFGKYTKWVKTFFK